MRNELPRLKSKHLDLQVESRLITQQMDIFTSALAPIRRITVEVLSIILGFAVPSTLKFSDAPTLVNISLVSRTWKSAAYAL